MSILVGRRGGRGLALSPGCSLLKFPNPRRLAAQLRRSMATRLHLKLTGLAALLGSLCAPDANAAQIQVYPAAAEKPAMIYLSGDIVPGDETKFAAIAAANSNAVLVLNSPGGSLKPALEIGKVTRLRGYTTVVYKDGVCASACALIWTAGTHRIIAGTGHIGFHASYLDDSGKLVETGVGNAVVGHYLAQLGYSEAAVIFATSAPPDKILWLNASTAARSDIAYDVWDADQASSPTKGADGLGASVDDVFTGGDAYVATAPAAVRNVQAFAVGLKQHSYKAEVDSTDRTSPKIFTEAGGYKMVISFSSCAELDCQYAELIAIWEGVNAAQANAVVRKYALEENCANIYYEKNGQNLYVYHYVIVGSDGITVNNLIENIEYFAKYFRQVASVVASQ